uniref:E3 ubiquitin-protein ligase Topors n=1 Tax=Astyanax mexicanus TaxID=7994 RepID=A0A3B1IL90_ASTMX
MTPTKMKLRMRKKEAGAKSSRRLLTETSPDSKCPICLDRFNNAASLDRCLHRFCFRCIHEWSKNKAECPLCKQPFRSIFHSVKAENDFKEFVVAPVVNAPPTAVPPPADQTEGSVPSGRVRRPRAQRGGERRSRRNQNAAPAVTSLNVRLEGLVGEVDQESGVHQMMLRLTERRRSRVEEHSLRRLRDQDVVAFRRALYRTGVRVRSGGWDSSRQRDISATHLRRNPACLRRLLPWLQRELTVLYGSHGSLVSIVQHIIMSRITHYDMDDAAIRDELRPFLLARTDHFLHELVSFARSTLSIEAYDQQAVYECPAPSYEEDSSSSSSIIAISEDDDDSEEADITEDIAQERVPPVPMATGGESSLSQSAWDDETPGPSYSTLFPSPSQSQTEGAEHNSASTQADDIGGTSGAAGLLEDEEEECMIVGYVKPMAERTPELVQLSSDSSEEEEQKAAATETAEATVPKAEASSSQVQAPPSPESYLTPVSPSSFPCPSASHSPLLNVDSVSPQHATLLKDSPVKEGERQSRPGRKDHAPQHAFRSSSRSSSESSVLSRHSGRSKSRRSSFSASMHQEQPKHQESRRWSHQSAGQSPTVSVASDSSDSLMTPSWEQPQSRERFRTQRNDEGHDWIHSVSAKEKSSQSSAYWDLSVHSTEQRKARKRRRKEKEKERSRSPLRVHSASHGRSRDGRHRHGRHKQHLRTGSRSSSSGRRSSSSSSSSADSRPDQPCPEKPSGKRKYKTRHLERAAQRQKSNKNRDKDCQVAHRSSPAKKHRGRTRERSRSPSVEIIFERRAPDAPSQTHWWRRKRHKKRNRRARERNSPTIITIDSDSDRTNDYQDCVTEVTNDTVDYQERVSKVSSSAADDQNNDANVTSSNADSEVCVSKASCSTNDNQHSATKVTSSSTTTIDEHHLDQQQHDTRVGNSNADVDDVFHDVGKVTQSMTGSKPTTEASNCATEQHQRVAEGAKSTASAQRCVTNDGHSSARNVTDSALSSQDGVTDSLNQPVKRTGVLPGEENRSPVTTTKCTSDSLDCALNLEHCVVDIVDRESFDRLQHNTDPDQPGRADDFSRDVSMPSDTRLLESILQELEDILPEEEEAQRTESRLEETRTDNRVGQLDGAVMPPIVQSVSGREPGGTGNTGSENDSQSEEAKPDMYN